jgi:hypothetical protein
VKRFFLRPVGRYARSIDPYVAFQLGYELGCGVPLQVLLGGKARVGAHDWRHRAKFHPAHKELRCPQEQSPTKGPPMACTPNRST